MRIAVISDIHSNIDALKEVVKDIQSNHVDQIISTGDLVGYLPFPNQVIDYFRQHKIISIKGNHDKRIAEHDYSDALLLAKSEKQLQSSGSLLFTSQTITDENREYLKALPEKLVVTVDDTLIMFVHGSPRKIDEYLYEDSDILEEIAEGVKEDIIVSGHTHIPYQKVVNGKLFINAGSVGKPKHGNCMSSYVIIEIGSVISCEICYVSYDLQITLDTIKNTSMISDNLIENLSFGT